MVLIVKLEEKKVRVIINSEANRSYILINLADYYYSWIRDKNNPYPLNMANRKPVNHDKR